MNETIMYTKTDKYSIQYEYASQEFIVVTKDNIIAKDGFEIAADAIEWAEDNIK